MGFTTFKKRDGQRFRKVYPRIRKTPKYFTISDETMVIETEKVVLTNATAATFTFQTQYSAVPTVQISAEPADDSQGMVNVFITALTTEAVIFETSAPFTGTIHIQVLKIG